MAAAAAFPLVISDNPMGRSLAKPPITHHGRTLLGYFGQFGEQERPAC
jgi:hypothetical protein